MVKALTHKEYWENRNVLLRNPARIVQLEDYEVIDMLDWAHKEDEKHIDLAIKLMSANPDYRYPDYVQENKLVDYWLERSAQAKDVKRLIGILEGRLRELRKAEYGKAQKKSVVGGTQVACMIVAIYEESENRSRVSQAYRKKVAGHFGINTETISANISKQKDFERRTGLTKDSSANQISEAYKTKKYYKNQVSRYDQVIGYFEEYGPETALKQATNEQKRIKNALR